MATDEFVPIEQVTIFYKIAYASFLRAREVARERAQYEDTVRRRGKKWTEEDLDYLARNELEPQDEERFALVAVIFSAFTLEALINDYLIRNFSKTFPTNYFDRLSTVSKWVIFPWLVTGKRMSTGRQTFQGVKKLFKLRNDLAHFKQPRKQAADASAKDRVTRKDAEDAIHTVRLAVTQLKTLDPRFDTLWRKECEKEVS